MPRKQVSEGVKALRNNVWKRINPYLEYFIGDKPTKLAKGRYLEALYLKHFHSYAILETRGVNERMFRQWIREDDSFLECCNIIRLSFVDGLEYRVMCRAGLYGPFMQKKYIHVDTKGMCDFLRLARYHGIYRRLKADGGKGKVGPAGTVSRDGEGGSCAEVEGGGEGDLCAIPPADAVPPES